VGEILGSPAAGDQVEVLSAAGRSLGSGLYHPHSLIAVRICAAANQPIDRGFFAKRLREAEALRHSAFPGSTTYRWAHGESDLLPGLTVDRYDSAVVVQTFSLGMDIRLGEICDAIEECVHPECIVERNESPLRELESLPTRKGVLRGTARELTIEEYGLRYRMHPLEGQKTGFFLDQRENRLLARRYCAAGRVLDCFCNDGGFALNAALGGASAVLAVDASAEEIRRAGENAELNGITAVTFEEGDVFSRLKTLQEGGEKFDAVILDPPSFTRSKKTVPAAKRGYRELHERAFRLLKGGGFLLTASCSHHIEAETFLDVITESAWRCGRRLQLLEWRGAAPDHPTIPGVPETTYLKMGVFRVR
jgi:23S rRNA (cytosine1962-C5)-methyltransferase